MASTKFDTKPLRNLQKNLRKAGRVASAGTYNIMFKRWAARYSGFIRRRYVALSRGGSMNGERWPPLAKATLRARRRGKSRTGRAAILRDRGQLFSATSIGAMGNATKRIPNGIRYGFAKTPRPQGDGMTFRKLAEIHAEGNEHLPERPILAEPAPFVVAGMMKDLRDATIKGTKR